MTSSQQPDGEVTALFAHPHHAQKPVQVEKLYFEVGLGIQGDRHSGTRFCDVRELLLKKLGIAKGTPIANTRHFSAICEAELFDVSREMIGDTRIEAIHLEPNLLIGGIKDISQLPVGTLLSFGADRTAVLAVWAENQPCPVPHQNIIDAYDGIHKPFATAARHRRGIVGFVYCGGKIKVGDPVFIHRG